jgi:hypothetical protein
MENRIISEAEKYMERRGISSAGQYFCRRCGEEMLCRYTLTNTYNTKSGELKEESITARWSCRNGHFSFSDPVKFWGKGKWHKMRSMCFF